MEERQNPEKRKEFNQKLAEYLKIAKEEPNKLQVWFWDESGFSLRVIRRKTWGEKAKEKKLADREEVVE